MHLENIWKVSKINSFLLKQTTNLEFVKSPQHLQPFSLPQVPMCLCETDDLDSLCDTVCQEANRHMITVHCPTKPLKPFLRISTSSKQMVSEIPLENLRSLINAENAISEK